jgi:AraC family transcriptional regulator
MISFDPKGAMAMSTYFHGDRKYRHSGLLLSSVDRGWSGIAADLRSHPKCEVASFKPGYTEVAIAMHGCSGLVVRKGVSEQHETRSRPGTIWLAPAGVKEEISIAGAHEQVLHLYMPQQPFNSLASDDTFRPDPYSLRYLSDIQDDMIREIGRAILSELVAESSAGRMFVEAAALALAARLAHSYAEPAPSRPQRFGSHRFDEIRLGRVLNYIAENLDRDITIAQLASVACLSPSHFASMFSRSIGVAPYRYVSQQRLESAKMMLADGKRSLSDIAFSCQFSSQTSFNRAFLRAIGVTPGEYRRARVEERYLALQQAGSKVQQAA